MFKKIVMAAFVLPLPAMADISEEANACIDELISRYGNIGGEVLDQLFSEAAIMVRLRDNNGIEYECIVWSGPKVAVLRQVGQTDAEVLPVVSGDQRVKFDPGTFGTVMIATLNPGTSVRYLLRAEERQFLNVDVTSRGGALDYRIFNPDGSALMDLGSAETPYQGQLWQSGEHVVEGMNAGAQPVSFDMGIGVK